MISQNKVHLGVRIGDKIIDNIHHDGVPAAEWAERFHSATDAPLKQQSRAIGDFFGKTFLTKQFYQWFNGSP